MMNEEAYIEARHVYFVAWLPKLLEKPEGLFIEAQLSRNPLRESFRVFRERLSDDLDLLTPNLSMRALLPLH